MPQSPLLIGCASGFSGDRTDGAAAVVRTLAAQGGGTLIFETLAERTLALAQLARNDDPNRGYEPLLDELVGPVLGDCLRHGINIVSNFGAANPPAAARRIAELAREQGLPVPRIAVVYGDALNGAEHRDLLAHRLGAALDGLDIVSATAYLGATEIAEALAAGAQIVVAGRVECGLQVTGGYFCVPGLKEVPDVHAAGFPIAEIQADGEFVIGKADGTGGAVDARTVKEQLLYEVHDPARYLTPDVVADLSLARVVELGGNRVAVHGITGHARPDELKVNVCYRGGWLAEAEISYAGVQAEARARLAADIVQKRLGAGYKLRADLIGAISILGDDAGEMRRALPDSHARDVRLRLATENADRAQAERVLREVTALYTCGPAGGGGVRTALRPRLNMMSCTIPREAVKSGWNFLEEIAP